MSQECLKSDHGDEGKVVPNNVKIGVLQPRKGFRPYLVSFITFAGLEKDNISHQGAHGSDKLGAAG